MLTTALCAIARHEEDYLAEWIDYHLDLGFDHIFIYDNDDPRDDAIEQLCRQEKWQQKVSVIDYRGRHAAQLAAYNNCYETYGEQFDWFAFLDVDEFLTFGPETREQKIGRFLENAGSLDMILVNWLYYGDNGKVHQEPGKVTERFPEGLPDAPANRHVKTLVRSGLPVRFVRSPYVMDGAVRTGDDCLRTMPNNGTPEPFKNPSFEQLYVRHYGTKTIEEYIRNKVFRGAADQLANPYRLDLFYSVNERSREKRAVEKQYFRVVNRHEGKPAPLVSVIVPNYNHSGYVRQRIDAILAQTFTDFELILLDDCSTDNSPNILLEYRNHPAVSHILLNTRNSGSPFMQWEKGIRLARGRYVWIAESDDLTDPDFLRACVEQLEKHPEAQICITGSHVIDSNGKIIPWKIRYDRWDEDGKVEVYPSYEYLLTHMLQGNSVYNASMVVFRRENCLKEICTEYRRMRYAGDWLFWIEQIQKGALIEIHRKLNFFRKHQTNTTSIGEKDGNSLREVFFIRERLGKRLCSTWLMRLRNRYEIYELAYKYAVSTKEGHKELIRQANRIGKATWWHYRLWKFYRSCHKHILHKPIRTYLDMVRK